MPRSSKGHVFKSRKGKGGRPTLQCLKAKPRPSVASSAEKEVKGISNLKLTPNLDSYHGFEDSENVNIVISLDIINSLLIKATACRECGGDVNASIGRLYGLATELVLECSVCFSTTKSFSSHSIHLGNSDVPRPTPDNQLGLFEVNARFVYALRCIGKGATAGKVLCGVMNLPQPPNRFTKYSSIIQEAAKEVANNSMAAAIEEAVTKNEGKRDISITLDGTWQKRGHSSLNGVVTATSVDTGKVLDIAIKSKYCRCKGSNENTHEENCCANYSGVSGGMEVEGVMDIFKRSLDKGVRYEYYLGDGDSKAFENVAQAKLYPDLTIKKLECIGHVQKRMGSRLRALKIKSKGEKLSDDKPLAGRNRLTDVAILSIQNYYGLAIRRNSNSLEEMKKSVWVEYFHLGSSNQKPNHGLCPKGEESWCKYQKAQATSTSYDHSQHFHLPEAVMEKIKPIFQDLAKPDLLKKCLHGKTQNQNESVNNVIWSRVPKNNFVQLSTLTLGVFEAVATFNDGNIVRCNILKTLGIAPGKFCAKAMKALDICRIQKSDREAQEIFKKASKKATIAKRKLEEDLETRDSEAGPSYGAGLY